MACPPGCGTTAMAGRWKNGARCQSGDPLNSMNARPPNQLSYIPSPVVSLPGGARLIAQIWPSVSPNVSVSKTKS